MTIAMPSEAGAWIDAWQDKLNESEKYSEVGAGWGVGFNGSFLFVIEPDTLYDGEPVILYVDLEDGECTEAKQVDSEDDVDWGFAFRGSYSDWKELVHGDLDAIEGMMGGRFDLDGDMQKVLQYSNAAVVMTENASEIDTEFEY
ncbi:SCP2 sterol-binding domain-containing protein [Haloarchaeobius sp. HME9146]|uniref:SCP2 sterol-binding domain-containing protein n=1 Tax=Haloarchaeobius sp. HME9146 TaxID=2978732 RepID=UPI0021BF03C0|nr:SCP2 sterol-binding domain-containing protein [Haloarchaeobius sp. HME9146]MCT9097324.1 SCP2 sterol-binding domain-containing protein [Haloarchaeobius sp. HME9146]